MGDPDEEPDLKAGAKTLRSHRPDVFRNQTVAQTALSYAGLDLYALQDVRSQCAIVKALPRKWSERELRVWQMDQEMNLRGLPIDLELVDDAIACQQKVAARENRRLFELTDGAVKSADAVQPLKDWAATQGVYFDNMQRGTLIEWREEQDDSQASPVREAIDIRLSLSRKSVAKFAAVKQKTCPETGRYYQSLAYFGAHTGRWAGRGFQMQNLARGSVWENLGKGQEFESTERTLIETIREQDVDLLGELFGDPMDALSSAIRACVHSPDKPLLVCDFAGIEARVLAWIAGQKDLIQLFEDGADIYKEMASSIYDVAVEDVTKQQRAMGKEAILGLGFGMGAMRFIAAVKKKLGIELDQDFAEEIVNAYRERFPKIKRLWWNIDEASKQAVANPGEQFTAANVTWMRSGDWLMCRLPNKRLFYYREPRLQKVKKFGCATEELQYYTTDSTTKQWVRTGTYGAKLVENIVQATARDLLVDAMFRARREGIELICTIHDEIIAWSPDGSHTIEDLERIMCVVPKWAKGCPIKVEGFATSRYRK